MELSDGMVIRWLREWVMGEEKGYGRADAWNCPGRPLSVLEAGAAQGCGFGDLGELVGVNMGTEIRARRGRLWLAYAQLGLGCLLCLCLLQDNFHVGTQGFTGLEVLKVANNRSLELPNEGSYLLMTVHVGGYMAVCMTALVVGFVLLSGRGGKWLCLLLAVQAAAGVVVGLATAWSLEVDRGGMGIFTKLLPHTSWGHWFAMVLQLLIFAVALGQWRLGPGPKAVEPILPHN